MITMTEGITLFRQVMFRADTVIGLAMTMTSMRPMVVPGVILLIGKEIIKLFERRMHRMIVIVVMRFFTSGKHGKRERIQSERSKQ